MLHASKLQDAAQRAALSLRSMVLVALCATTLAACRPSPSGSPAAPTRAAGAAPTAWADATPDADGYYADPEGRWLEMLDAGPIGPLLVDVQAALDGSVDAKRLTAFLEPVGGRSTLRVASGGLRATTAATTTVAAADVAAALRGLGDAGSTPRIQGFTTKPNIDWTGAITDDLDVWVIISGWRGDAGLLGASDAERPRPAGDSIDVWRFRRSDGAWRWIEWAMPPDGYRTIVADLLQLAAPPPDRFGRTAVYSSVRPRTWWPANNAPCEDVSTSPDGEWIVCTGERGEQRVGPRSPAGEEDRGPTYMARRLEVRSAKDDRIYGPVNDWTGDGAIGVPTWAVLGWLDGPVRLVFAEAACGEGCGFNDCGVYGARILDLTTGHVTSVDLPGWRVALDAAHHRLASADDAGAEVHAIDLDTWQRWTIRYANTAQHVVVGSIEWAADGGAVVIEQVLGDACASIIQLQTVRFNLEAGTSAQVGVTVQRKRQTLETPVPDVADSWGYAPGDDWFEPIHRVDDRSLLVQLQALLDARDAPGLAALASGTAGASTPVKLRAADGQEPLAMLSHEAISSTLSALFTGASPHQVAVQGSVHGNGTQPGTEDSSADVWVVTSGWPVNTDGESGSATAGIPASTSAMVWRFTPTSGGWRWLEWRTGERTYRLTVDDLRQDLQAGSAGLPIYTAVRRAEWWPPINGPCSDVSKSPDGAWIACYGEGEGQPLGSTGAYFRPLRLGIRRTNGATLYRPVSEWAGTGIGQLGFAVVGWTSRPAGLLVRATGCGDGCGAWQCAMSDVMLVRLEDGTVEPVDMEGYYPAVSPDGTMLATLGPGEQDTMVLRVRDLAQGTERAATLAGEDGDIDWSPDGSRIAVTWDVNVCADDMAAGVKMFDVTTGTLSELVPLESGWRYVKNWSAPGIVDVDVNRAEGESRWVGVERRDARTGALIESATATPTR